jgi:hypothetical protein
MRDGSPSIVVVFDHVSTYDFPSCKSGVLLPGRVRTATPSKLSTPRLIASNLVGFVKLDFVTVAALLEDVVLLRRPTCLEPAHTVQRLGPLLDI